ncbi:MAG: hypothetical protein ACI9G1_003922 [Pirellulaceae bacterium]|jgi:hypothetical protein
MIKLVQENFIAVSVPTWVCRADCPEGEFLRGAGIDKRWVTSSGYMNCISASGKMLGGRASQKVLDEFNKLPESERKPGAIRVAALKQSENAILAPPAGGLVLKVHARFLAQDDNGKLRHVKTNDFPLMRENARVSKSWQLFLQPNTEYMWLKRDEWQALIPAEPIKGMKLNVDPAIGERMARFHLTPQRATTSEGGIVSKRQIKSAQLNTVVEEVTSQVINMRLEGFIHWGSDYDAGKATSPNGPLAKGFETPIHGRLTYDRKKKEITKFDMVAPGRVWGRWGDANGKSMYVERAGQEPFGFAFELATGKSPSDRIPPGGNGRYVTERGYFGSSK